MPEKQTKLYRLACKLINSVVYPEYMYYAAFRALVFTDNKSAQQCVSIINHTTFSHMISDWLVNKCSTSCYQNVHFKKLKRSQKEFKMVLRL